MTTAAPTHDDEFSNEPPSIDVMAGEYVLGVLDASSRRRAQEQMRNDPAFAALVEAWERHLSPLHEDLAPIAVPGHLLPSIRRRLGWQPSAPKEGLWQSLGFWRGTAALAAGVALCALIFGQGILHAPSPPDESQLARTVTTLAHDDGTPGWLASVDLKQGAVLMVPVPASADALGRVPELWLIAPGEPARSLGIVSINKSHTVKVPSQLRRALMDGSILAITLEPPGGAPAGVATGPIIAKGTLTNL
jgi:anti-sigma-K factor RskA